MNDDFMPDSVDGNQSRPCYRNFGYNKIYYNPATTYDPPVNSENTPFAAATYTAAKVDGFQVASATTNLSTTQSVAVRLGNNPFTTTKDSFTVKVAHPNHGLATGASVRFTNTSGTLNNVALNNQTVTITKVDDISYTFTSPTKANKTGTGGGNSPTRANFSLPTGTYWEYVADPTAPPSTCQADTAYRFRAPADQTNYANWYAYYRTRLNMMKSASGRAFATIDGRYRIGLDRINNRSNSNVMVNIKKFDAAQKSTWYTQLYGVTAGGFTPLRGALSKAGRLYAGKVVTGDNDPVQYKCQQNFAILTTDGYWNLQNEVNGTAVTNYGPRGIDNVTLVGDQDGSETKHYKDAGAYQNTLADVAMYFYKTDLRDDPANKMGGLLDDNLTTLDVTPNDVQGKGDDAAKWQHMTTFALGLGVAGTLNYRSDYEIGDFGDYFNIGQGTKSWPNPDVTNNATELPARIDDLWHAAVNGRGRYLSASSPDSVIEGLTNALATIAIKNGSAAAAATSTLEPVAGDQDAYLAQFTTEKWYGDLQARLIITKTGAIDSGVKWSARDKLNGYVGKNSDSRAIMTFDATGTNNLKDFEAANLTEEIDDGYFKPSKLTQWGTWGATQKSKATSEAMIDFIRGQTGFENEDTNLVVVTPSPLETSNENMLFRDRDYVLGDIVNTSPVYVQSPPFNYGDAGYAAFKDLHRKQFNADGSVVPDSGRLGAVYVGANDGMLHAFRADTGVELWAYIPSAVVPNLYKLADAAYANNHQFYVDGPITVGDAYDGSAWKTVLVGGLGRGGKAYYALDVTDPEDPKALWEFGTEEVDGVGDKDLGYSYGNAILTKRSSDGKWVVIFASGYNNDASGGDSGDSKGRLYVVDAFTGKKLNEFETKSVADPDVSGIAKINNWVLDTLLDNVTRYVYGGDLGGSLWRFDL
jgi:type IV pilus assembly protein PilY1